MIPAIYAKIRCIAYLGVDWDFTPPSHPPSSRTGVDTSGYTDRSDGQVNIRPELKKSSVSSPSCLGRSEDLNPLKISPSQKAGEPAASSSNGLDRSGNLTTRASPFISALDMFNEIVPNCDSKKIVERFQRDQTTCLGNTLKGIQCRRRNRSEDRQEIEKLLTELAEMNLDNNRKRCVVKLLKLTDMAVCTYQRKQVQEKVRLLVTPRPLKDSAGRSASPIIKEDATKVKLEELPAQVIIRDKRRITRGQKVQSVDTSIAIPCKITKWWKPPKSASSYFPKYLSHKLKPYEFTVSQWVMRQAAKPLTPRQCKVGYLYVYWNKATFGIYKIGFTTLDVDTRLKSWESKCKHTAQKLYESPLALRNVERVERLVHAELDEYRVKEFGCHGCGGNHDEWFERVHFDVIVESIEFWTEWIMKEDGPYEEVESTWRLKEDAKKELPELCSRLSVVKAKESKAKPRRKPRPRTARRTSSRKCRGYW